VKKVSIMLTKGLSAEDKKALEDEIISKNLLISQLERVLKDKIKSSKEEQLSKTAYTNSSWPYLQADYNGYQRAILEIITLLQPREQSDNDR
jgi:hypothetical protein